MHVKPASWTDSTGVACLCRVAVGVRRREATVLVVNLRQAGLRTGIPEREGGSKT